MAMRATTRADITRMFEKKIMPRIEQKMLDATKLVVEEVYEELYRVWPFYTFWSIANHRISISGRDIALVRPRERPEERYALLDYYEGQKEMELMKLRAVKPGDRSRTIVIGNAVPYAANVGFKKGQGLRLYREAARTGTAIAQAKLKRR